MSYLERRATPVDKSSTLHAAALTLQANNPVKILVPGAQGTATFCRESVAASKMAEVASRSTALAQARATSMGGRAWARADAS